MQHAKAILHLPFSSVVLPDLVLSNHCCLKSISVWDARGRKEIYVLLLDSMLCHCGFLLLSFTMTLLCEYYGTLQLPCPLVYIIVSWS
jgi:hypothetical protein